MVRCHLVHSSSLPPFEDNFVQATNENNRFPAIVYARLAVTTCRDLQPSKFAQHAKINSRCMYVHLSAVLYNGLILQKGNVHWTHWTQPVVFSTKITCLHCSGLEQITNDIFFISPIRSFLRRN